MKTSELRKWLEVNKWKYDETAHYIEVLDLIKVFTESQVVKFNEYFYSNEKSLELIKVVIEYTNTPISEREDEKKYYFEFGDKIDKKDKKRYLNLNTSSNGFFFHHDWEDVEDLEEGGISFKGEFTQQEIDNLPAEIKGAIDCGFLRKVEVDT